MLYGENSISLFQPAQLREDTERGEYSVESKIGKGCKIGQNVVIGPNVTMGNNVKIQNNVSIYEGVTLEDDVFCGRED